MFFSVGTLHPRVSVIRKGGSANDVVSKNAMQPFLVQSAGKQSVRGENTEDSGSGGSKIWQG